jgi:hypothetical protein
MAKHENCDLTDTEILALELHRHLRWHNPFVEDIRELVEELEHRPHRSSGVDAILAEGHRFLAEHRRR